MRTPNGSENEAAKGGLELLRWGVERMVFEPEWGQSERKVPWGGLEGHAGTRSIPGDFVLGGELRPQRETGPDPPA